VYAAISALYLGEMAALWANGGGSQARAQYQELDARLSGLMTAMESLALKCPLIRALYSFVPCSAEAQAEAYSQSDV
jgi:hypothetical protein